MKEYINKTIAHIRKRDKKPQPLWEHLQEVSNLTENFADKIGLNECGKIIGLLHDFGKGSKEFQNYLRSAEGEIDPDEDDFVDKIAKKGKIDHSTAGAQIIYNKIANKNAKGILTAQILSTCIASHHSGIIDFISPDGEDNFTRRITKSDEKAHTNEALANLTDSEEREVRGLFSDSVTAQLNNKLKMLTEKNDSNETLLFKFGLLVRLLFSCLIDADRVSTADFEFPGNKTLRKKDKNLPWDSLVEKFDTKKFEIINNIDILRSNISQECFDFADKPKGLYQLTVPTGGGKTFASLRFALNHAMHHKMDRIFYIIPYTSIIEQNAEEVRKILEDKDESGKYLDKVVLEHHSNLTPELETKRQSLLSENWDAPIVFTTQVQFLETFFASGTSSARRMHQLVNSVIIFDEVQTIPIRCVHIFNMAVRFLMHGCGSTVILCTATQPLLDNVEPKQRSLVIQQSQQITKDTKSLFAALKRVNIHDRRKVGGWAESDIAKLVKEEIGTNSSVLIVVNTKSSAKRLYEHLKECNAATTYHLSTNMCPAHRMNVLRKIKSRLDPKNNQPTICVSTQLIEAGVDIDFGSVIRYLAGLDSIAQAAGRCNRHGLRQTANVYVINPKYENLSKLDDIRIGKENTERVLDEYKENPNQFDNDLSGPLTINRYYYYYFYARKNNMNYPVNSKIIGVDDNLFSLLSSNEQSVEEYRRNNNGVLPTIPLRQAFQTAAKAFNAIDAPTRGVIVPYGKEGKEIIKELCSAFDLGKEYHILKRAQRYSVNVYTNTFNQLAQSKAIYEAQEGSGVFYLDDQYYSDEIGLSIEIVNEMETFIIPNHK